MQINSVNSPAFGCGACSQIKKLTQDKTSYECFKMAIKSTQKEEGTTHGQAASKVLKFVKIFVEKLNGN